ncbi:MAG TPA: helix-turn-helix transcriptional regulator [Myxococcaceae bacterium]|nr:helix-turn-helix transcriptional regulator [Myxococcaceae bacterium]
MPDFRKTSASLATHLGLIAREARTRAGLTQEDVAERMELASEVYGRLERGRMLPSLPTLMRLCLVLRVEPNELLGFDSHHGLAWMEQYSPSVTIERPELRRLLRTLRELGPEQLATFSSVAHLLLRSMPGRRSDRGRAKLAPS